MRKIGLGFLFLGLTVWAQNSVLLVLHKGSSSLGFYSPAGKLLQNVPVGQHPHEMVLSADGRVLYITDNGTMRIEEAGSGGNTLSIVDVAARKKIGEISLGRYRRPHGIALNPRTGRLYVDTELPDALLEIDPVARKVVKTWDTNGRTSHMVTLGLDGRRAYVCNSTSNDVSSILLSTGELQLIPTGERPEGSVLSHSGEELYVCNRETQKISVISAAKQAVVGEITTGRGPLRAALTPDGKLLVYVLYHDEAIEIADPAARKALASVKLGGRPVSLSVSPDGRRAYASVEEQDTVYVVSIPDRKILQTFKTAPGSGPDPVREISSR
jgi:DNA-binding beta-propeller fold protein YncE